jgi:hypothetical protein
VDEAEGLDATNVLEHEPDYDGTWVFRGFGSACALSACLWVAIIAGCAQIDVSPGDSRVASAAHGGTGSKGDCGDVPMPPPIYDHAPAIPTFVRHVPFGSIDRECRDFAAPAEIGAHGMSTAALLAQVTHGNVETKACSWRYANLGFVLLPDLGGPDATAAWEACVLRHEYGHINGWPASHPGARFETSSASG